MCRHVGKMQKVLLYFVKAGQSIQQIMQLQGNYAVYDVPPVLESSALEDTEDFAAAVAAGGTAAAAAAVLYMSCWRNSRTPEQQLR